MAKDAAGVLKEGVRMGAGFVASAAGMIKDALSDQQQQQQQGGQQQGFQGQAQNNQSHQCAELVHWNDPHFHKGDTAHWNHRH